MHPFRNVFQKLMLVGNPLLQPHTIGLGRQILNDRIHVNTNNRFVLYRIPKSANSTVLRTILEHDPAVDPQLTQDHTSQDAKDKAYFHPSELGIVRSHYARSNFFHFTVVRNPYHRALSVYLDKIAGGTKKGIVCKFLNKPRDYNISFEEFLNFLQQGGSMLNAHWAPQTALIPKNIELGMVGRVETLDRDMETIIKIIFPEQEYTGLKTWASHATRAQTKVKEYYTRETALKVEEIYGSDFDVFKYNKNLS